MSSPSPSQPIRRVWIDDGCISCNLCEDLAPEVFEVPVGADCQVRPGYRERLADYAVEAQVVEAAESCPTEVIRLERD